MGKLYRAIEGLRQILSASPEMEEQKASQPRKAPAKAPVKGIMFVSKPRGAKDDVVRTAATREEAQKLAKETALIVSNKSQFLPRSGVSVRSRRHVIFDFEHNVIRAQLSLTSESDTLDFRITLSFLEADNIHVRVPAACGDMTAKKRGEYVETLRDAIESLSLLDLTGPPFVDGTKLLQAQSEHLQQLAREKLDERQRPWEAEAAETAAFQKLLDQLPKGTFVVQPARGFNVGRNTGMVSIHDGLTKLKRRERVHALTQRHADKLGEALSEGSAHARLTAMRLLEKIPEDHPLALPHELEAKFGEFKASGDLLARLETLEEMSEEEQIGEVFLVNPKMINTYSSYDLPYGYKYGTPWDNQLSTKPLVLSRKRKSLPNRPSADLITFDGVLCVSEKAKSVLETLNLGGSKFHYIDGTDDYWAMEITETKEGPVPDDGLYELTKEGQRRPLKEDGMGFYPDHKNLDTYSKRARFGADDLEGPDVWLCEDLTLDYRDSGAIVVSEAAVTALKKAKCKWYKRVYPVRVVD